MLLFNILFYVEITYTICYIDIKTFVMHVWYVGVSNGMATPINYIHLA